MQKTPEQINSSKYARHVRLLTRNAHICTEFDRYSRRQLRLDIILTLLCDRYGLSAGTIWAIVKRYGRYKK